MTLSVPRRSRTFLSTSAAVLVAGAMTALAQQPQTPPAAPAIKPLTPAPPAVPTVPDKATGSYALGVLYGINLRGNGFTPDQLNTPSLLKGMHDAMLGKARMNQTEQQTLNGFGKAAFDHAVEVNHAAADAFLAENGKKPGILTTSSGLQYKVLKSGSGGDSPKPTDLASVNYRGSVLDGGEFDSNAGKPPVELTVNRLIPGWTEALTLMKAGDKWQLWVPPKLAYDTRSPPPIPPGSLLAFDVELVSFKAAPPAPTPPAGAPPPAAPTAPKK